MTSLAGYCFSDTISVIQVLGIIITTYFPQAVFPHSTLHVLQCNEQGTQC